MESSNRDYINSLFSSVSIGKTHTDPNACENNERNIRVFNKDDYKVGDVYKTPNISNTFKLKFDKEISDGKAYNLQSNRGLYKDFPGHYGVPPGRWLTRGIGNGDGNEQFTRDMQKVSSFIPEKNYAQSDNRVDPMSNTRSLHNWFTAGTNAAWELSPFKYIQNKSKDGNYLNSATQGALALGLAGALTGGAIGGFRELGTLNLWSILKGLLAGGIKGGLLGAGGGALTGLTFAHDYNNTNSHRERADLLNFYRERPVSSGKYNEEYDPTTEYFKQNESTLSKPKHYIKQKDVDSFLNTIKSLTGK